MTIFGVTLQVKPGWNISWECSILLKPISLSLRVNKESPCDGTKVRGIVIFDNLIFVIVGVEEKDTTSSWRPKRSLGLLIKIYFSIWNQLAWNGLDNSMA